jgi:nicotinamide riboside kinase
MNELRVAIDGAQSTGKTTLWRQLREHYGTQLDFIPEVSREIAPRFGIISVTDWPVLLADRVRLLAFFKAEEEWLMKQERSSRFLTDSSLYAIQAYRSVFHLPINRAILEFPRYDLLLYCALASQFSPDGFRFLEHREHVDAAYRQIVGACCKQTLVELPSERRLDRAINLVDAALAERSA